jgi:hypothetical protein
MRASQVDRPGKMARMNRENTITITNGKVPAKMSLMVMDGLLSALLTV